VIAACMLTLLHCLRIALFESLSRKKRHNPMLFVDCGIIDRLHSQRVSAIGIRSVMKQQLNHGCMVVSFRCHVKSVRPSDVFAWTEAP
jgi:hypothetical protein